MAAETVHRVASCVRAIPSGENTIAHFFCACECGLRAIGGYMCGPFRCGSRPMGRDISWLAHRTFSQVFSRGIRARTHTQTRTHSHASEATRAPVEPENRHLANRSSHVVASVVCQSEAASAGACEPQFLSSAMWCAVCGVRALGNGRNACSCAFSEEVMRGQNMRERGMCGRQGPQKVAVPLIGPR